MTVAFERNPVYTFSMGAKKPLGFGAKIAEINRHRYFSPETRKKIAEANRRRIVSKETCEKISIHHKNSGIKPPSFLGKKHTPESIEKIRQSHLGKSYMGKDARIRMSERQTGPKNKNFGKPLPEHVRKKIGRKGSAHHFWKGGITPINRSIRNSFEYKEWRKKVFQRDLYTCVLCGEVGGELNADHIKQFAYYPELRFQISNGRTLCVSCHEKTETFKSKKKI